MTNPTIIDLVNFFGWTLNNNGMEKFNRKYRIKSARCPVWDYRSRGAYFITICTKNRIHYFGQVSNHKMILSEAGKIVCRNWEYIPNHFPHASLDTFVVMPNHFHGIIILHGMPQNAAISVQNNKQIDSFNKKGDLKSIDSEMDFYSRISPANGSISTIIRSYKSSCTRDINLKSPEIYFAWQPRFYDIIIRDRESHERIRNYISKNPRKWKHDLFNK